MLRFPEYLIFYLDGMIAEDDDGYEEYLLESGETSLFLYKSPYFEHWKLKIVNIRNRKPQRVDMSSLDMWVHLLDDLNAKEAHFIKNIFKNIRVQWKSY